MKINHLSNGNLEISLETEEITYWQHSLDNHNYGAKVEGEFIESLSGFGFYRAWPEDYSCLTDAPMIKEDGLDGESIYAFMDYQIHNFVELLCQGKSVIWQKG